MKAVVCRALGSPSNLRVEDMPMPEPAADQALVRILAAGVNFADVLIIAGRYQVKPPLPFIAGQEFAGEVVAVGEAVRELQPGDRVMGSPLNGGAFAEYIAAAEQQLWKIPQGISTEAASGLLIGHGTAYFALQHRTAIWPGEWLLVTGAAGGVGLATVEIGKRLGLRVIAAAGSQSKLDIATAHGADAAVNYTTEDLRARVKEITLGHGYDVLFDTVGGDIFDAALRAAAPGGRLLVIGFAAGRIPSVATNYLLLKNLALIGAGFGAKVATDRAAVQGVIDGLAEMHRRQPFAFEIGGVFDLDSVPEALQRLAERRVSGKLVIKP